MSAERKAATAPASTGPRRCPRLFAAFVAASMLACVAPVAWASAQPLVEADRVQLLTRASVEIADPAAVHQAILEAAGQRAWKIQDDKPGHVLMLAQTGTHVATVDVDYDGAGFQIKYQGSQDMDYAVEDGHPVIHPRYNRWVTTLSNEIRRSVVLPRKARHGSDGLSPQPPRASAQAASDAK